ncbi:uncharacterized protein LOC127285304 [Leptopilina boulardi]|uniref:uncharacterized protein LOC127285304 n=1 Tax=Leptopilina boulardi TaxID=63433 RepID=UPI0021F5CF2E|nr:uncharacterized protein LOC127285304 [Leptopilina boulardi]
MQNKLYEDSQRISSSNSSDFEFSSSSSESNDELSSSSEDSDTEDNNNDKNDTLWLTAPLYENSEVTCGEAISKILEYQLSNAHTKASLEELLKLLLLLLPDSSNLPKTKYFLYKHLSTILPEGSEPVLKHRFCNDCLEYLGTWDVRISTCHVCKSKRIKGMFLEYSISSIIKEAFETKNLAKLIDEYQEECELRDDNYIYDINSGSEYKKLKVGKYDIVLTWFTDGIQTAKSDKFSLYPIQAQIVNIHPKHRRNFQFTCGLYYTKTNDGDKPNMNTFLTPFSGQMQDMYINEVEWFHAESGVIKKSKVVAPIATMDAPAKAEVLNLMHHNGEYGCPTCEHPGETAKKGKGINHVFPPLAEDAPNRTHDNIVENGKKAKREDLKHSKGIKGPTVTEKIPHFNLSTSLVPDYMHIVVIGVFKLLLMLWFCTTNKNEEFYVNKKMRDDVEQEINRIFPTDDITRTPRPLSKSKFWKASEKRAMLLLYFPVILQGILKEKYYQHFLLLVRAMHILLQEKIHPMEINLAETLLYLFVSDFPKLYGLNNCTYNVHMLLHLAQAVRNWGPLWAWSAFPFEDENGYLVKMVHGPGKVEVELFNTMKLIHASKVLKTYFEKSCKTERHGITNAIALGRPMYVKLEEEHLLALKNGVSENLDVENLNALIYSRAKIGKNVFTSSLYQRQKKRNNANIYWNNQTSYGSIKFFIKINGEIFVMVQKSIRADCNTIIHKETGIKFHKYIVPIRETYTLIVIPIKLIEGKFTKIQGYATIYPNTFEKK